MKITFCCLLLLVGGLWAYFEINHSSAVQKLELQRAALRAEIDTLAAKNRSNLQELHQQAMAEPGEALAKAEASQPKVVATTQTDPFLKNLKALTEKATRIFGCFEQTPEAFIPELDLLNSAQWIGLAEESDVSSPEAVQKTMAKVRIQAKTEVLDTVFDAYREFRKKYPGAVPRQISELQPFFKKPLGNEILGRYESADLNKWEFLDSGELKPRSSNTAEKNRVPIVFIFREKAVVPGGYETPAAIGFCQPGGGITNPGWVKEKR